MLKGCNAVELLLTRYVSGVIKWTARRRRWEPRSQENSRAECVRLMSFWFIGKKYGVLVVALAGAISSSTLAFTNSFKEISLDARTVWVGATAFITVAAFALLLSRPLKPRMGHTVIDAVLRCLILALLSWGVVRSLELTAAYHNVRVFRKISSLYPNVGSIEFQPPRFPVDLTIKVWVPQNEHVRIEKLFPSSWNPEDPADLKGERNRTGIQDTLFVKAFKSAQVFGIWYELNGQANALDWDAIPEPANVRVLRESPVRSYRRWSYVYGGGLWVIGVCFCLWRWFWEHNRSV